MASIPPRTMLLPQQQHIITIHAILASIALVTVLCRTYVRAVRLKAFRIDDLLMLGAQVFNMVALGFLVEAVRWGQGRPLSQFNWRWWKPMLHWNFIFNMFAALALNVAKVSIGFHLLRFFDARNYRRFLYLLIFTLIFISVYSLVFLCLQCLPLAAVWDYSLRPEQGGHARCVPTNILVSVNTVSTSVVLATDVILALLPIRLVWRLRVATQVKVMLCAVLGLGLLTCMAGSIKLYHQVHVFDSDGKHNAGFLIWVIVEMNLAIIASSLPTIKPLFASCLPTPPNSTYGFRPKGFSPLSPAFPPETSSQSWHFSFRRPSWGSRSSQEKNQSSREQQRQLEDRAPVHVEPAPSWPLRTVSPAFKPLRSSPLDVKPHDNRYSAQSPKTIDGAFPMETAFVRRSSAGQEVGFYQHRSFLWDGELDEEKKGARVEHKRMDSMGR